MKIPVVFYSTYGHVLQLARAAAEGAAEIRGTEVQLYRVTETLPNEVLEKMGALDAQKAFADIPAASPEVLKGIGGLILASSTRYGMMTAQMKSFLDSTGGLWAVQELADKPVAYLTSTATQHGGLEMSALSAYAAMMHHGMIPVGLPYTFQGQMGVDEIKGGSPYGASTIAGGSGERMASAVELEAARYQGRRLADIAIRLQK
jgi:NAD(P)H dehydrogenase (quinone)